MYTITVIRIITVFKVIIMKKQHFSKKREDILNTIYNTNTHPTAEWVYDQLKPKYSDLSLGTVYRNIGLFKDQGLIKSVGTVNGKERFDGNTKEHAHFVCSVCGVVLDIENNDYKLDVDSIFSEKYGINIYAKEITFYGKCNSCI